MMSIDYDKLKLIEYLADKIDTNFRLELIITHEEKDGSQFVFNTWSIDAMLEKLQELAQPVAKYKYEIGEKVWFLDDNEAKETVVTQHENDRYILRDGYIHNGYIEAKYPASNLYPTKAELIAAQIEYWQTLRNEEWLKDNTMSACCSTHAGSKDFEHCDECCEPIHDCDCKDECRHESDGTQHYLQDIEHKQPKKHLGLKCNKCGEFYK